MRPNERLSLLPTHDGGGPRPTQVLACPAEVPGEELREDSHVALSTAAISALMFAGFLLMFAGFLM
eukprot:CAMPEP_0180686232 /NCGR_PEP_ID=MMETSP1037_2-20121125/72827_1 /TAXON_ID=632150 /ORGANISM="Azadinium spinosum, Strain 3D9" /LENGTH=65 /DNA_ID=CAMNT_0022716971 /DNA_START=376 /DNA_END=573 /DNA_ORIENTATION=+